MLGLGDKNDKLGQDGSRLRGWGCGACVNDVGLASRVGWVVKMLLFAEMLDGSAWGVGVKVV